MQPDTFGDTPLECAEHYLRLISTRIARVRITCGDWKRVVTPIVLKLSVAPHGVGVFLDPPYIGSSKMYASDSGSDVAKEVVEWCKKAPSDIRIVLAGYDNDNDALTNLGWRKIHSRSGQGCGYSSNHKNGRRERLWLSPSCLHANDAPNTPPKLI